MHQKKEKKTNKRRKVSIVSFISDIRGVYFFFCCNKKIILYIASLSIAEADIVICFKDETQKKNYIARK
jgi:hypothetical protein